MRTDSDALAEWSRRQGGTSRDAGPTPDAATANRPPLKLLAGVPVFDGGAIASRFDFDRDDVQYVATVLAMAVTIAQATNGSG